MIRTEFKSASVKTEKRDGVTFYSFPLNKTAEGVCGSFELPDPDGWLSGVQYFFALHVPYIWWMIPAYGTAYGDLPENTIFLLCRLADGTCRLFLPLVDGAVRGTLRGSGAERKFEVYYQGMMPDQPQARACLLAAADGKDPYELVHHAMSVIRDRMGTFELRENKPMPEFIKELGWCTWDAFQQEVSADLVRDGLESFKKDGITPRFMILDDGWLCTSKPGSKLITFQANPVKFPNGLKELVSEAKEKYGIRDFAVWHTFQGYWQGITPSPLLPYKTVQNAIPESERVPEPTLDALTATTIPAHADMILVDPSDVGRFYDDFYAFLKSQGVSMTKVDNQCTTPQIFSKGILPRVSTTKAFSYAMQAASEKYFGNNTISCMCNSNDLYFHLKTGNVWRNSDDNAPHAPLARQLWNLHCNAKAAFFSSTFSWPDWDMVQSTQDIADVHAAARAVSGGPVYLSDGPKAHNTEVIGKLVDSNGDLLRPDQPGIPTEDCLFVNLERDHFPMKIMNRCGEAGILALFNCCVVEPDYIHAEYALKDIRGFEADDLAVWSMKNKTVRRVRRSDVFMERLTQRECEVLTAAPVVNGFAAIGLEGKYLPFAVFTKVEHPGKGLAVQARCGGTLLFYAERKPSSVTVNGKAADFKYGNGLVRVSVKSSQPVKIRLR